MLRVAGGHGAPPAQQAACRAEDPREGPAQLGAGGGPHGGGVALGPPAAAPALVSWPGFVVWKHVRDEGEQLFS